MSEPIRDIELTERFLLESVPTLFAVQDESDIEEAFTDYMGRVKEVAGPRGSTEPRFQWDRVMSIVVGEPESPENLAGYIGALHASRGMELAIGDAPGIPTPAYGGRGRTVQELETYPVTSGVGTFVTIDANGKLTSGIHEPNNQVDSSYGHPTHYVFEKLGWAKVAEVLARQGGDWGEGYEVLTDFLRRIGRIGLNDLPHVGMATSHEIPFSEETKGADRHALAYGSASNYTLNPDFTHRLLQDPRFFEQYKKDLDKGLFTNIADWLAGRTDSLVAQTAIGITNPSKLSMPIRFPYLDTPDYVNVNNN